MELIHSFWAWLQNTMALDLLNIKNKSKNLLCNSTEKKPFELFIAKWDLLWQKSIVSALDIFQLICKKFQEVQDWNWIVNGNNAPMVVIICKFKTISVFLIEENLNSC